MTILPIVDRELRVASRRTGTYWSRSVWGLNAILVGVLMFLSCLNAPSTRQGVYVFNSLGVLVMIYCLLAGWLATTDCLSGEKQDGTLGLLFLTDLKGRDVVFGKLAATSLKGFYGLLTMFPVIALPLMMGGITSRQFWTLMLVLLDAFLFSSAIGMFCSAVCREPRKARGLSLLLLFCFVILPPACAFVILANGAGHVLHTKLFFTSPLYCLFLVLFGPYIPMGPPAYEFWASLGIIHALTWLLLFLATIIAPRSWQDKPVISGRSFKARVIGCWRALNYGRAAKRPAYRKHLLDINAFYWLAARACMKPLHVWGVFGLIGLWWVIGYYEVGSQWLDDGTYIFLALMMNTVLKLWVAIESGQRLAEAHQTGGLELLLCTPLDVRKIVRGQWLALRRQFLAPFLLTLALELWLMHVSAVHANVRDRMTVHCFWLAGIILLPMDMIALFWVAMAQSLRAKHNNQAVLMTVLRIMTLPWIIYAIVMAVTNLLFVLILRMPNRLEWPYYIGWYFGLGLFANILFGVPARLQVLHQMRELAVQRFAPPVTKAGILFFRRAAAAAPAAVRVSVK